MKKENYTPNFLLIRVESKISLKFKSAPLTISTYPRILNITLEYFFLLKEKSK